MVKTFGTDANNDIYIGRDGNMAVANGLDAVKAACESASKAQLGEMLLTTTKGIPNFQTVWIGNPNYPLFQSYLRKTLLSVAGVLDVPSLEITVKNKVLQYTAKISTIYGEVELSNG